MCDYDEKEIEDSLEFCRQIEEYYEIPAVEEEVAEPPERTGYLYQSQYTLADLSNDSTDRKRPTTDSDGLKLINNIFVLLICVALAYFIASLVTHYVAHQTWVEGPSMEPTLSDGDSIIIERLSYYFSKPKRYDVVVFPVSSIETDGEKELTYYVKRVIGLPGETLQIRNGKVYIDGKLLEDDTYCLSEILDGGMATNPVTMGQDEYFVLGDNRNMSTDSRNEYVGLVRGKDILGEVCFRIWPLKHIGAIQ